MPDALPSTNTISRADLLRFDLSRGFPTAIEILREALSPLDFLRVLASYSRLNLSDPLGELPTTGWPEAREKLVRHQLRAAVLLDMAIERALSWDAASRSALLLRVISATGAKFIESFLPLPEAVAWRARDEDEREAFIRDATNTFFNAEVEAIYVEDELLGFDIKACRFVEHVHALGRPHLAAMFCAADAVFFERDDSPVRLERTGTIATGAQCCDFRFTFS